LHETGNINQTTLINFVPTRSITEIAHEYIEGFMQLYDPVNFLDRTYRHYQILGAAPCHQKRREKSKGKPKGKAKIDWNMLKAFLILAWRQGVVRETRVRFWIYLMQMFRHNRGGIASYLGVCAQIEHFLEYRDTVKANILAQLSDCLEEEARVRAQWESSAQAALQPAMQTAG
jgi:hypothetical protein